jgi:Uma2 family endonuclease
MPPETLTNFTYQDLLEMPDDGRHYEILDGELIVNAAPIPRHQRIVFRIASILDSYVRPRKRGEVFISPIDVVFSQEWVVEPDVIYISRERRSRRYLRSGACSRANGGRAHMFANPCGVAH